MCTPAVRNLIREGKTHQIYSSMQAGGRYGMQTMDMSLAQHIKAGASRSRSRSSAATTPRSSSGSGGSFSAVRPSYDRNSAYGSSYEGSVH